MTFRLTTVATFRTPTSAWVARNYLAEQGILAHVFDDNIATAIWTWGNAIGWTKLQVETEFEQAAYLALQRWREARDLLLSECENKPTQTAENRIPPPPCMDRKPVTAAEKWQPTPNEREDLVRRGKFAAVYSLILLTNALGLPGAWARLNGIPGMSVEVVGLGLLGYSTCLLWTASLSQDTLGPLYLWELFWGRCINVIVYSMLVILCLYFASFSSW